MNNKNFPRGSEWSKWDLHIHTPCSIVQGYGGNTETAWDKYIADLEKLPPEFKAIGINDYIFLDGYRKVLQYKAAGRLKNIDLILPVIELRLDKFASLGADDPWKKVNFHIIFSDILGADVIERNFLNAIQHKLKFDVDGSEEDYNEIITHDTLIQLGKKVKEKSSRPINDSDLKTGFNSLTFNFEVIFQKLEATTFKDKFLTAIGKGEWDTMRWDASPGTKRTVINKANFVLTALEKADTYEKQKQKLTDQNVNDKLIDCSDAHHFSDSTDKDRIGNCFTWLKANTTFEGLKQVANESTRIFIGDIPPLMKRVSEKPTRYIKKLSFQKTTSSRLEEIWFDNVEVEINSGLVAIIGNKGNGKSALTDCIGLVGNTPNHKDFSFLGKTKFRSPRPNRSESFNAYLTWETDVADEQNLAIDPHPTSIEKVKYIPQGFLEKLCNENHENFEDELRNVIFTHIPDAERYGKYNLVELAKFRTDTIQNQIDQLQIDMKEVNEIIVAFERKEADSYLSQLKSSLEQKNKDLEAHKQIKPAIKEIPTDPKIIEQNKDVSSQIEAKRKQQVELETNIENNIAKQKGINLSIAALEKVLGSLTLLDIQYQKIRGEIAPTLVANEINIDEVIKIEIKRDKIASKITGLKADISAVNISLDGTVEESLPKKLIVIKEELRILQSTLDEPSKQYQKYLNDLAEWTATEKSITGEADEFATLKYYEVEINYVETKLQSDILEAVLLRTELLKKLFAKKNEILNIFKTFYKPITDFIESYGGVLDQYEIKLDIENKLTAFEDKFFAPLSAGAKGSFLGITEGRDRLTYILNQHEWITEEGIISLLQEIVDNLKHDTREGANSAKREIDKQLKAGFSVEELYGFLFGLDYLEPTYKLKLNNKNISELSPGERGALLLIFYLALDQNDIPLVIDQPEENLDNQSVFKLLAQFIKKAKNKRQIIIVTHNPNLAVVCDADQIIHVKIEKHNKNKVIVNSGALENPTINKAVVDILEGTYEAFDTRDTTYKVIPR